METFELKMLTDLSTLPTAVKTNLSEVEPLINAAIEKTKGLLVSATKEAVDAADDDAAYLTKLCTAVKRFRIDNLALWTRPMNEFETKCKEIEKRIEAAATALRASTSAVKDKWKAERVEMARKQFELLLNEAYADERLASVRKSPCWGAFFATWSNPKQKGSWANATTSIATVTAAIKAEIQRVNEGLAALKTNYSASDEEVKKLAYMKFCDTFDITATIGAISRFIAEREQLAEARRIDAERKAAAVEAAERAKAERAANAEIEPSPAPAPASATSTAPAPTPTCSHMETYRLEITGPRDAIKKMRDFGLGLGISFRKI